MYSWERKRVLARLKQAEKKGLPAHDSACIKGWVKRAEFQRERAKDKTIKPAAVRQNLYESAIKYLIFAQDLLTAFESSISVPSRHLEEWLKELGLGK